MKKDGRVVGWGLNDFGQTNVPASATNVIAIAAGGQQSLALFRNQTVMQWGQTNASIPTALTNVTAIASGTNFAIALLQMPKGCSLLEAVRVYRQSIAAVQRKPLAEAVKEFCDARRPKAVSQDGKRPALSPVYVQDTERQLNEFAAANIGADVCDLTKQHLDLFVESHAKLSPKSRNHYRATLRMFFGWCQRRDYLAANHRLLEADGLRKEDADTGDVDYYRPAELHLMLDNAAPQMAVAGW